MSCFIAGIVREAKAVREHYWKPYMRELFEKRVRHGALFYSIELVDINLHIDGNVLISINV